MQATIEIEANLIPEGYEPIAFREPQQSDDFIRDDGRFTKSEYNTPINGPRLILRRKWQWPSWLTCRSIAKDDDGTWYGFNGNPAWDGSQWIGVCGNGGSQSCCEIQSGFFDLSQLPECSPEDSLRNNPNWKE